MGVKRFVIFDLDGTLVDTSTLDALRAKRDWKACASRLEGTSVYPGIRKTLMSLVESDIEIAVVTNSVSFYAAAVLKHHGIQPGALVCYHDTALHKPHPDPIYAAMRRLAADKTAQGYGVGDHLDDCSAYKAAGLRSIGAAWSRQFQAGKSWDYTTKTPAGVITAMIGKKPA